MPASVGISQDRGARALRKARGMEPAFANHSTRALWSRLRSSNDPAARSQLLKGHLHLVHAAARRLRRYLEPGMEFGDLIGVGTLGLIQAIDGFDEFHGSVFSTYATKRIRGAILDELHRLRGMPRLARERGRRIARARETLERRLGRAPEESEIAAELSLDPARLQRWRDQSTAPEVISIHGSVRTRSGARRLCDTIADVRAEPPDEILNQSESACALHDGLSALSERDRLVLTLSYYERLRLKEIAEILNVTESRVSQVRTRALRRLREYAERPTRPAPGR